MKKAMLILIMAGSILTILGVTHEVPEKRFYFSNITEYVGGDAYNAMIEASLRGGEIAGEKVVKALYICSGIITISIGVVGYAMFEEKKEVSVDYE